MWPEKIDRGQVVPGLMYHVKDCAFGPKGPLDGLRKKGTLSDLHFIR